MQISRHAQTAPTRSPAGCLGWIVRLGLLFLVLGLFAIIGGWLYLGTRDIGSPTTVVIAGREATIEPDSGLGPAERAYLRGYLLLRAADLEQPAGEDETPVAFSIVPGETAADIADRLAAAGLINDSTLFRYYLRYYGLDARLEAGDYTLRSTARIPEIAQTLTHGVAAEIEVRITEGWRLEQTADYLAAHPEFNIGGETYLVLARREMPVEVGVAITANQVGVESYEILADLPPGATLEGYLFPDTYRLPADATAADLVAAMLSTFGQRVSPELRQALAARGLTLHEAITLASIVEREAQLPGERPIIASVFLNRLAQGIKLDADPTVQYALGYQVATEQWWKRPLYLTDLEIDSPYNTYRYPGLPPGPIASPGLASIEAVAYPAQTSYLYFVVDCTADVPGTHAFSETFDEHQANVSRCQ